LRRQSPTSGGGLRLAHAADAINVGAVVRATEDNFALVECFDREHNTCVIATACGAAAGAGSHCAGGAAGAPNSLIYPISHPEEGND